ncbi:efflux RND transporter periplasmic adaptor subunit [Photobacterium lipolyticum]|uniref:Efflux RND transporter periplasmic adaptor subunit n=1 Tax=Photobacterium lipolyticum TaxID=266810 RepID=A0A2T3N023_9GAMM|nr:efflux RND transporter periplasmic adaptor subunit [Photobacterium lipolyticum]PSW05602.1 efflux RND transporter periplasmic adaptor subunit [Photobacterium lipolyticum]
MKKQVLTIAAFISLAILFFAMSGGFVAKLDTTNQDLPGEPLANRTTVTVMTDALPVWQSYTGTIVADQQATLSARLTAQVAEVLVDVGDEVKAGDILIRLDNLDLDARVRQTEQALASMQAQLNVARKEYTRTKALIAKKLVAQSKLDDALSALQSAQANFRKTQASLEEAQTTYGYSIIAAPFDGVITQKLVNKGDIASPGVAMLSLYNPLTLMMESDIAASKRYLLKLGQQWPVSLPEQNILLAGVISEITPASDVGSRSVVVKLTFENSQQPLYPGLFARVKIKTDEHQALIIPQASTYRIGQLQYVKVVDGDRVVPRLIETRPYNDQQLIVRKGVTAGTVLLAEPR